jgi:hypothetical protein
LPVSQYGLLELLELFAYTEASRPRDKLFALLPLAPIPDQDLFSPDYESPLEVVIHRYASIFVSREETLELLYRAGTAKKTSPGSCLSPSWIPDWTRTHQPRTISTWFGEKGVFSAAGDTHPSTFLCPNDSQVLVARGRLTDEIVDIMETSLEQHDVITFYNAIRERIGRLAATYPTGEPVMRLKRVLPIGTASRPHVDMPGEIQTTLQRFSKDEPLRGGGGVEKLEIGDDLLADIASVREMVDFLKQPADLREHMWKYWGTISSFSRRLCSARLCTTKRGYLGLVPGSCGVGDWVCVVNGGAVPFILRPSSTRDGTYSLVGEGYIHGIMYGEALRIGAVVEEEIRLV